MSRQLAFTNPVTDIIYRLIADKATWRITRSQTRADGHLRLAHLRGEAGSDPLPEADAAQLVKGCSHRASKSADPALAMSRVVLRDLDATADYLIAVAREAAESYKLGWPGFRAKSGALRLYRDRTVIEATAGCRAMAQAWKCSGLPGELSALLKTAGEDDG